MKKKYHLISLGCPKNLIDSEIFSGLLPDSLYQTTDNIEEAEIIIINTCGFINSAKKESIETIIDAGLYKEKKCKKLIVTGCLVKRYLDDLKSELPEVDHFINLKDFESFAQVLNIPYHPKRNLLTPSHYAYLRISDGCENYCTYCAIPLIRGRLKSIKIEEIVKEAEDLVSKGVKEIIITAQDTALYGMDIYGKPQLSELLKEIHKIEDLRWIRLLYLHPAHITEKIAETISHLPKVLPYFDVPLQHIDDDILLRMNRKIDSSGIEEKLDLIKKYLPNAAFRTTFIIGFPGESYHKFNKLKKYIQIRKFHRMGVFGYSKEEDTAAYDFTKEVSQKTINKRIDEIMSIQQTVSTELMSQFVGKTLEVIIDNETSEEGYRYEGRSYLDAPDIDGVVYIRNGNASQGDIVNVNIVDSWEYDMIGDIVE